VILVEPASFGGVEKNYQEQVVIIALFQKKNTDYENT
jgi:hypothetical protein